MGDAGEGLIDQESRIQERMEDLAREKIQSRKHDNRDPEQHRAIESLRLARTELDRQRALTTHDGRRAQLSNAIEEVERRIALMG